MASRLPQILCRQALRGASKRSCQRYASSEAAQEARTLWQRYTAKVAVGSKNVKVIEDTRQIFIIPVKFIGTGICAGYIGHQIYLELNTPGRIEDKLEALGAFIRQKLGLPSEANGPWDLAKVRAEKEADELLIIYLYLTLRPASAFPMKVEGSGPNAMLSKEAAAEQLLEYLWSKHAARIGKSDGGNNQVVSEDGNTSVVPGVSVPSVPVPGAPVPGAPIPGVPVPGKSDAGNNQVVSEDGNTSVVPGVCNDAKGSGEDPDAKQKSLFSFLYFWRR